jgi:hypothetical protein
MTYGRRIQAFTAPAKTCRGPFSSRNEPRVSHQSQHRRLAQPTHRYQRVFTREPAQRYERLPRPRSREPKHILRAVLAIVAHPVPPSTKPRRGHFRRRICGILVRKTTRRDAPRQKAARDQPATLVQTTVNTVIPAISTR